MTCKAQKGKEKDDKKGHKLQMKRIIFIMTRNRMNVFWNWIGRYYLLEKKWFCNMEYL